MSCFLSNLAACTVIQGTADAGKKLTEDELQKTMDFVKGVFAPTDPEMYEAVGARLDEKLLAADAPVMTPEQISQILSPGDDEAKFVLSESEWRKIIWYQLF